jgi:uncharacterized glyoxalase superfamily protein PhnB
MHRGRIGWMKSNRSVPPATVVPVLSYPDVRAAVEWLSAAFGYVERTRIGDSHRAQMSVGADAAVIVAEGADGKPARDDGVRHLIRVRVEDVGAQFERARAHGARVLEPPTDREYGERDCTIEDLAGHRWQFAETVRDVAPEEYGCKTVAPWPGRPGA